MKTAQSSGDAHRFQDPEIQRTLTAIDEAAAMYLEGKQAHASEARAILNRMNDALGVMLDEQL